MVDYRVTTRTVLLVRPTRFGFNRETAASNRFQSSRGRRLSEQPEDATDRACREFDGLVEALVEHGVEPLIFEDTPSPETPDALFPNNWISVHRDGSLVLYPMLAANRRAERRRDIVASIERDFKIERVLDLSPHEAENRFLEGTGSFVLDRRFGRAFACHSPRTDAQLFTDFCRELGYEAHLFRAVDKDRAPIYHTNVMLSVGRGFAVVALDAIEDETQRAALARTLEEGRRLIPLTHSQMKSFAANILELDSSRGPVIALSTRALAALTKPQLAQLEACATLVAAPLDTIETIGGGGCRCMIAEIFASKRTDSN